MLQLGEDNLSNEDIDELCSQADSEGDGKIRFHGTLVFSPALPHAFLTWARLKLCNGFYPTCKTTLKSKSQVKQLSSR